MVKFIPAPDWRHRVLRGQSQIVPRRLSRLPIRVRLTLISAVATTIVFSFLAWVLYANFEGSVNASINSALIARAGELRTLDSRRPARTAPRGGEDVGTAAYFQILSPSGRVLEGTRGFAHVPLIAAADRAAARRHPVFVSHRERSRLYVLPSADGDLIVAGVSLGQQQESFITFNWELLAGTPLMVLIAAAITYLVGGKLLSPVEAMRRQAANISTQRLDARLPLPESVDEIHHLATTLNAMLERLSSGLQRELRFVSDASHELRTPLTVLRAELEVALRIDGPREEYRAAAESAVEETDRLISLSENLLVLARAQDDQLRLNPVPVPAAAILRRVADRAQLLDDTIVSIDDHSERAIVRADESWLEQALLNLVANARRHGGGAIVLYAVTTSDGIELHVRDHGDGFPMTFLPRAFERFSRADASRARGGAGLGLSIVAMIARAHQGDADARNHSEGGADVWITLPPYPPVPQADADARSALSVHA